MYDVWKETVCSMSCSTVLTCCNRRTEPQCGVTGHHSVQIFLRLQLAIVHCSVSVTDVHGFPSASGYRGKNCEENIDDCPGNLCQNGATCVDDINRYSCLCPPTYMGELCEQDVDECGQRPSVCQNGATCTNSIGGFSCICVNGWAGPDCSVNIDDCAGAACFNGATCIDRVGSFYCRCTPGKTGMSNVCSTVQNTHTVHVPSNEWSLLTRWGSISLSRVLYSMEWVVKYLMFSRWWTLML